ncbi:MAG: LacI family DNA-binding transcriptional regulator [Clostridia bacterium]|nr:LacI family DNA-binding transcriptional regulator [Clostridia bacterium]
MSDIREVAELARVSTATVSNALNAPEKLSPQTLENVLNAIRILDYRPNRMASALAGSKTKMIGVIISDIYHPNYARSFKAISEQLDKHGYSKLLMNSDMSLKGEVESANCFLEYQVDGVILKGTPAITEIHHIKKLCNNGIPVVTVGRQTSFCDSVNSYMNDALMDMFRHLESLGHREIGIMIPPIIDDKGIPTSRFARLQLVSSLLQETSLEYAPENLLIGKNPSFEEGKRMIKLWLDRGRKLPTAIFVLHEYVALGVEAGLRDAGIRVPEDVSIIDCFGSEASNWGYPPLSTIDSFDDIQGEKAVELLLKRIEKPNTPFQNELINAAYIRRASVGAPNGGECKH